MGKSLKRLVLGAIYCTAFFLPIVLSFPANSQSLDWVKLLGSTSGDYYGYGYGVAADTSGNIYVTGYTDGNLGGQTNAGGDDAFLAKYDGSGTRQWVKLLGTALGDYGYGVAADTSGNIYVTGFTNGDLDGKSTQYSDAFLAKYDGNGTSQWVKILGSLNGAGGYGVTVDTSGNIYVTGTAYGDLDGVASAGGMDVFLAKYNSSGTRQWVQLLGTTSSDYGYGVTVDTSGNIYVTGYTDGDLGGDKNLGGDDAFLAKYNSSGTKQWVQLLGTASNDYGYGVAADTSGNIYVTGYTGGNLGGQANSGNNDAFLAKYDGSGTRQWVQLLGTASNDYGYSVAADTSGNIYVTGYTDGNLGGDQCAGGDDIFLAKYDGSGTRQWVQLLGTASYDYGHDVAVDTSDDIYVTGFTAGNLGGETNAGNNDIFLAKYTESFPWEIFYPAFIKKQQNKNDSNNFDDSDLLLLLPR